MMAKQKGRNGISYFGGAGGVCLALAMLLVLLAASTFHPEEDPIYDMCQAQTDRPGPWCYQEEVERVGDPDLCENILTYWPNADGVHGWCYYRLALLQKDCTLCDRIHKDDIKRTCRLDCK